MFPKNSNIQNQGANAINNTGNDAKFEFNNYNGGQKILNRTYLYDFCFKFSEVEDILESYNTEVTSDIEEKMNHNELDLYKDIFLDCDHYIDDVEAILEEIPKRQRILSTINNKYKRLKKFADWQNKDQLCEWVYEFLIETIENDHNSGNIFHEDVELAIHSLMYYAFTKCKLLDPIPQTVTR